MSSDLNNNLYKKCLNNVLTFFKQFSDYQKIFKNIAVRLDGKVYDKFYEEFCMEDDTFENNKLYFQMDLYDFELPTDVIINLSSGVSVFTTEFRKYLIFQELSPPFNEKTYNLMLGDLKSMPQSSLIVAFSKSIDDLKKRLNNYSKLCEINKSILYRDREER